MRVNKRTWVVLLLLLVVLAGYAVYRIERHFRGKEHSRAAEEALQRRDFRQASRHLKDCLAVWPGDSSVCLLAARTARRQGDHNEAVRQLRACKRAGGPEGEITLEHRLLRIQQGELAEAETLLASYLDAPQAPETYLVFEALIEARLKVFDRAFASGVLLTEGPAAGELASTQQAVAWWCRHRSSQADQVQGLVWRGRIHLVTDEREEARGVLRTALEQEPDNFDARLSLAAALALEVPQEAAEHLEVLRQRDPENNTVLLLLASFRRALSQLAEARQILDGMLAANPDDLAALVVRGQVALDADRPREAEPFLRRALALAPNEGEIHFALGRCLSLAGEEAEAKQYQERFNQLQSEKTQRQREHMQRKKAGAGPRSGSPAP